MAVEGSVFSPKTEQELARWLEEVILDAIDGTEGSGLRIVSFTEAGLPPTRGWCFALGWRRVSAEHRAEQVGSAVDRTRRASQRG